jgi:hypothetical protein
MHLSYYSGEDTVNQTGVAAASGAATMPKDKESYATTSAQSCSRAGVLIVAMRAGAGGAIVATE